MKNILDFCTIKEMGEITANMYRQGWDERNGGNISVLLCADQLSEYLDLNRIIRKIPTGFDAKELAGKILLVTGTGKYFKNIKSNPEGNLGIIRISKSGDEAELLWGYSDGGSFTSELPAHLMSHIERLKIDPQNRVIMHTHPTHILAMNFVHKADEKELTKSLWRMCTECMVVFGDGIGVLPWMLSGTKEIGIATAKKMQEFRLVVWWLHGIYGAGKDLDEAFGLIETVEKAAQIYMLIKDKKQINTITDQQLIQIANGYGINYRKDFM